MTSTATLTHIMETQVRCKASFSVTFERFQYCLQVWIYLLTSSFKHFHQYLFAIRLYVPSLPLWPLLLCKDWKILCLLVLLLMTRWHGTFLLFCQNKCLSRIWKCSPWFLNFQYFFVVMPEGFCSIVKQSAMRWKNSLQPSLRIELLLSKKECK